MSEWPKIGDRVIFVGVPGIYFPMFTDMGDFARNNLKIGEIYEIVNIHINSSWVTVHVKGFESQMLNWKFFKFYE